MNKIIVPTVAVGTMVVFPFSPRESELIPTAIADAGSKKGGAAEKLGGCRRTLWKKTRDLRIPGALGEEGA